MFRPKRRLDRESVIVDNIQIYKDFSKLKDSAFQLKEKVQRQYCDPKSRSKHICYGKRKLEYQETKTSELLVKETDRHYSWGLLEQLSSAIFFFFCFLLEI